MPSSVLRRSAVPLRPQQYPFLGSPWANMPREVAWTASTGIALTAGASNVLSAWTDVFASTAADCDAILFSVLGTGVSNQNSTSLMSLSTGTAGNETTNVIVSEALVGNTSAVGGAKQYLFPVRVAAGTRLSIAAQCAYTIPGAGVYRATLLKLPYGRSPTKLDTYGATTASSSGVAVTANDTYVEVTSATTIPYQGLVVTFGSTDTGMSAVYTGTVAVGVGAAAAEVEIARAFIGTAGDERQWTIGSAFGMFVPVHIGAGNRIAVKGADATANTLNAVVHGVPYG